MCYTPREQLSEPELGSFCRGLSANGFAMRVEQIGMRSDKQHRRRRHDWCDLQCVLDAIEIRISQSCVWNLPIKLVKHGAPNPESSMPQMPQERLDGVKLR